MADMETAVMELIVHAGNARSCALQAIREARAGHYEEAHALLTECDEGLDIAHETQTKLIAAELNGDAVPMNLLMIHAQDHLMNAMTIKDLAVELIAMMEEEKQ